MCYSLPQVYDAKKSYLLHGDVEGPEAKVCCKQIPQRPWYIGHVFKASDPFAYPTFNLVQSMQTIQNTILNWKNYGRIDSSGGATSSAGNTIVATIEVFFSSNYRPAWPCTQDAPSF